MPLFIAGNKSFIGEILSLSGAKVLFNVSFKPISNERLLSAKPEIAILPLKRERLKEVESFLKKFKITTVKVSQDNLLHPSPRILKGLKEIEEKVCKSY